MTIPYEVYLKLSNAVHRGDNDTVERLLMENKHRINEKIENASQQTLLHMAVGPVPNIKLAKKLLELSNIDVNIRDEDGLTPLSNACFFEDALLRHVDKELSSEVREKLISLSSQRTLSLSTHSGYTPLSVCKTKETAELLLKKGANLSNAVQWDSPPEVRDFVQKNTNRIETFKYLKSNIHLWGQTNYGDKRIINPLPRFNLPAIQENVTIKTQSCLRKSQVSLSKLKL